MSLDGINEVDAIGIDKISQSVVLTIIDDLDWRDEESHLLGLQSKINTYLRLIQSGEILNAYPAARNRKPSIQIVAKHELSERGQIFVDTVKPMIVSAGVNFSWKVLD